MTKAKKDKLKKALKAIGLFKTTARIYCWGENLYVKGKDLLQYLRSPFLNAAFKKQNSADGLPFPSVRLVHLVTNTYSYQWFYETGITGSQCIRNILDKNNFEIGKFTSVLDFGCGCGRVMRHWNTLHGPNLYGSDYNPVLIKWCRENLPFA